MAAAARHPGGKAGKTVAAAGRAAVVMAAPQRLAGQEAEQPWSSGREAAAATESVKFKAGWSDGGLSNVLISRYSCLQRTSTGNVPQ